MILPSIPNAGSVVGLRRAAFHGNVPYRRLRPDGVPDKQTARSPGIMSGSSTGVPRFHLSELRNARRGNPKSATNLRSSVPPVGTEERQNETLTAEWWASRSRVRWPPVLSTVDVHSPLTAGSERVIVNQRIVA
jgi:hypothetical protein